MRKNIDVPGITKAILKTIPYAALILGILLLLHSKWYLLRSSPELPSPYKKELVQLALNSLESRDVPVASLLIYRGKIIGRGYNTVVKNTKAGEHAEINAVSNAIDSLGFRQFQTLNRDSLCLLSTYEPCMMCAGAMVIYNIQHVYFLKAKPLIHNLHYDARLMRYFGKRKTFESGSLQDSLFYLHPDYPK